MRNIFTKHPSSIGESYLEHLIKAFRFGLVLLLLSVKAFAHAFFPFLFESTVSEKIHQLHNTLQNRRKGVVKDNH